MTEPRTNESAPSSSGSSGMPDDKSAPEAREESYFDAPEVVDATVQITSPAPEAVGHPTRYSRRVGDGDARRYFAARAGDDLEATAAATAEYCRNCPISHQCAEEGCAVYRLEAEVLETLERAEGRTAVAGVVLPAPVE